MDIFKFAMQMEKDGEKFYREQIQKTTNEGLKYILNMLAEEEVKHFHILEKLSKNIEVTETGETKILKKSKNVFVEMKGKFQNFGFDANQAEFYKKAFDIEKKSYDFYIEKANEVQGSKKNLLLRLAEEEKKHMFLMENIHDFVTTPDTWIENAEFNHLDEY